MADKWDNYITDNSDKWSGYEAKPKEKRVGSIFGTVSESEYNQGKRNILGNIFERPAAAVRAEILSPITGNLEQDIAQQGEGFKKGWKNPTGVPTFQDEVLNSYLS